MEGETLSSIEGAVLGLIVGLSVGEIDTTTLGRFDGCVVGVSVILLYVGTALGNGSIVGLVVEGAAVVSILVGLSVLWKVGADVGTADGTGLVACSSTGVSTQIQCSGSPDDETKI